MPNEPGRVELAALPTPLALLSRVSQCVGRAVYIKRDDMTGVSLGGNKVRKLEYELRRALDEGCDTVLTTGAAQSNHAMLTAACCARLGLEAHLVLKKRGVTDTKGNLLLDSLLGAHVVTVDTDDYAVVYREMNALADELRAGGRKPYIIPVGASTPLGALGYVRCAREMAQQGARMGLRRPHVVCCSGSGGTHGGLLAGAKLYLPGSRVTGIMVSREENFAEEILGIARGALEWLGEKADLSADDVRLREAIGEGYGVPSPAGNAAICLMARKEGIMLDPVYTGKAFGGLLDMLREGVFERDEDVVFIHTGGAGSLFAYDKALLEGLKA